MSQAQGSSVPSRKRKSAAAVFVDYDNLFDTLEDRNVDTPENAISTLLSNLVRNIRSEEDAEVVRCSAYADFADLPEGAEIQQGLIRLGCKPCFVDREAQLNASEIQLCIDAIADTRGTAIDLVVVVSGSRQYLPLLQALRAEGRRVKLVALVSPTTRTLAGLERQSFLHAARMLGDAAGTAEEDAGDVDRPTASDTLQSREFVEHKPVVDPVGLRTLRIVEEFFGQYDEVYLTPLLRKLSALLEDDDPKTVIADLEDCGAVWLEKRQGFPYDYTVLVMDDDHPAVIEVRDTLHKEYEDLASESDDVTESGNAEPKRRRRRNNPEPVTID